METIQTYRWNTPPVVELPRVTILIPVFNEEVGVEKTIMSALNQVGVSLQVIVINDGSIDNTAVILDELSAKYSNLQVIHKANTGKADSLNVGLSYVATPTYFTTDGDTILHRMAISRLLETLNDRSVGAVGGQVIVGNQKLRVLTALQALEYCNLGISFYLSIAGKGFIAPGAIGGYQTDAVAQVGGYSSTDGEDLDMSAKLTRSGYKIKTNVKAKCYTDAPESCTDFLKQRFRWNQSALRVFMSPENFNYTLTFLINYILPALGALSKLSEVNVEKEVLFVSLILLLIGYLISHVNKNIDDYRCFLALPLFPIYQTTLTATFGMSIALYFLKIDIPWHKLNRNTLKDRA